MHTFLKLSLVFFMFNAFGQDFKLPSGFKINTFASDMIAPRQMIQGSLGTIFVGSRKSNQVIALFDQDGNGFADYKRVIAEGLNSPSGVSIFEGDLYISEIDKIWKLNDIENWLINNPSGFPLLELVSDKLPDDEWHGWKWLMHDEVGNLYTNIGAPCNVCLKEDSRYASIVMFEADTWKVVARGVRNSVGFDFHPESGEMYFGDNGRDLLGDDSPSCELNRLTTIGTHFGFPFLHDSNTVDPEYGSISHGYSIQKPILHLGAHVAPTGLSFYNHNYFGDEYRNNIFITLHGSWNRSSKVGYKVIRVVLSPDGSVENSSDFLTGFLNDQEVLGRPAAPLILQDGSMLISDDKANKIYRISKI